MVFSLLQHFPLQYAYLCQDCDSIGNCAVQCPACASQALMDLSTVLDRRDIADNAAVAVMPAANDERLITMAA
jgi:hypothetical protein